MEAHAVPEYLNLPYAGALTTAASRYAPRLQDLKPCIRGEDNGTAAAMLARPEGEKGNFTRGCGIWQMCKRAWLDLYELDVAPMTPRRL